MSSETTNNGKIESLIRVASRLIGVMNHEVEMLRAMRVSDIEKLRDEKAALTVAYEECITALRAQPEDLAALTPALRDELGDVARRFDDALNENALALAAVRDSNDRLLKAIVEAVAEKRARGKGYTAAGAFDKRRNSRTAPTLSLTFDRRL